MQTAERGQWQRQHKSVASKVIIAILAVVGVAGCGSNGLSASSTCQDFASASPEEQAEAISSLSSQFDTPNLSSPLGSPEVGYECTSNPDQTLEDLFEAHHANEP